MLIEVSKYRVRTLDRLKSQKPFFKRGLSDAQITLDTEYLRERNTLFTFRYPD